MKIWFAHLWKTLHERESEWCIENYDSHTVHTISIYVSGAIFNRCNANGEIATRTRPRAHTHKTPIETWMNQKLHNIYHTIPVFFGNFRWTSTRNLNWPVIPLESFFFISRIPTAKCKLIFFLPKPRFFHIFPEPFFSWTFRVIKCFFAAFNLPLNPILFRLKQLI